MTHDVIDSLPGARQLVKAIAAGDLTAQQLRSIPAQNLYMAIQALGLESIPEVLLEISPEQYQLLLDFELWSRDSFQEEHFFEWLFAIDEEDSFESLEKLLLSMDVEILALIVARRVEAVAYEEPTDEPPGPRWYTPDKGNTWVLLKIEEPRRHRAFGKLLAYLFQRSPETFYQLVLNSGTATALEIEEQCYQTQRHRLSAQGIPDHEEGWRVHAPMTESVAKRRIGAVHSEQRAVVDRSLEVTPSNVHGLQPLGRFIDGIGRSADVEAELAKLLNAAVVYYGVDFSNAAGMERITIQVRGAINIGIERALEIEPESFHVLYEALSLQGLYQLGLGELSGIRAGARRAAEVKEFPDPPLERVCELAQEHFPRWPAFLDGIEAENSSAREFTRLAEVRRVEEFLDV